MTSVGQNPLVVYIAHFLIVGVAAGFVPDGFSLATGVLGFAIFWGIFAGAAYAMQRKKIFVKL